MVYIEILKKPLIANKRETCIRYLNLLGDTQTLRPAYCFLVIRCSMKENELRPVGLTCISHYSGLTRDNSDCWGTYYKCNQALERTEKLLPSDLVLNHSYHTFQEFCNSMA